ncbi:MAG: M23 family metallopeptidase [Chloroflexi bacterium]|nr:M23 family metallopeptidase [Chloroflexota bacterium]
MMRPHAKSFLFIGTTVLALLGCGLVSVATNPAPLAGVPYWTAQTATPVATVTVFLGTTTPVFPPTPIPGVLTLPPQVITTVPEWTTATATSEPPWLPPTATPFGFTATPLWITTTPGQVTTTPEFITETPVPPWTTTPSLPLIGHTTPVPTETPYYRVGTFYMNSDIYLGSPQGPVLRVTAYETQPSPNQPGAVYHYLTVQLKNLSQADLTLPLSDWLFVRQVDPSAELPLMARWTTQNEPLIARQLPPYIGQLTPVPAGEIREMVVAFTLPEGEVEAVGFITNWQLPVEGGLPIWVYLHDDLTGPYVDAVQPPPPTPAVLDDPLAWQGSVPPIGTLPAGTPFPGGGQGLWPTTGTITRGFGCSASYTGIDGTGYGCPPERIWFHNGVDIANSQGTLIWSPVDGNVVYAGPNATGPDCSSIPGSQPPHNGLGFYQRVQGSDTLHYLGHLSGFFVTGGPVAAAQGIAEMGSTGCSTGSHLHWIVYLNGQLVDPAAWAGPGP